MGSDVDGNQEEIDPVDKGIGNNDTSTASSVMKNQAFIFVLSCVSSFLSFF